MREQLKKLTSDSAVYGVSNILGRFITFLLVPFYTNVLPAGEYGMVIVVYSYMGFLNVLFTFGLLFGLSFLPDLEQEGVNALRIVGLSVGGFMWLLSIPKIIAGVGLLKRMEWSRILTLVLAVIALINFPLGTALGVYSLVILLRDEAVQLFRPRA